MFRRLATSSLAMAAMTVPALSEITPAEVWDQLIAENEAVGMTVTEGSRDEAGANLTITDAVFAYGSEASSIEMTMPRVVLNETGDGAVRWVIEGDVTGTITENLPEGEAVTIPFTMTMPGNETVTTGSPEDLTHEYKADTITFTAELSVDEGRDDPLPLVITMEGLTGTQRSVAQGAGGGREIDFDGALNRLGFAIEGDVTDVETGEAGSVSAEYGIDDIALAGQVMMADAVYDLETQMDDALRNGMNIAFELGYAAGAGGFTFSGTDTAGVASNGEGQISSGPGKLGFALSQDGLSYSASVEDSQNRISSSQMPFPIEYAVSSGAFDLDIPVLPSDQPAPFKLLTKIAGLTINDEIWALFDPTTQLSRDPADLNIDVEGDLLVTELIFTPPLASQPADEPVAGAPAPAEDEAATGSGMAEMPTMPQPPMPVRVALNDVSLKAVGAEAKLNGELRAPEGSTMSEAQVGTISGEFTGIEPLLTTLSGMGFIQQEQMMAARMMLTMFARPVEGEPDKLTTELEFREDGSIFANGQQVR